MTTYAPYIDINKMKAGGQMSSIYDDPTLKAPLQPQGLTPGQPQQSNATSISSLLSSLKPRQDSGFSFLPQVEAYNKPTAPASFDNQFFNELKYDIEGGATTKQIMKAYPELKDNVKLIEDLKIDILKGHTFEDILPYYPELSQNTGDEQGNQNKQSFGSLAWDATKQVAGDMLNVGTFGAANNISQMLGGPELGGNMTNVLGGAIANVPNMVGTTAGFITGNTIDPLFGTNTKEYLHSTGEKGQDFMSDVYGVERGSMGESVGQIGSEIAALFTPIKGTGLIKNIPKAGEAMKALEKIAENSPRLYKYLKSAVTGATDMAKFDVISKGELDPVDITIGAVANPAFTGIGEGIIKTKDALMPSKTALISKLDDLALKASQGAKEDIKAFKNAVKQIDVSNIKTYEQFKNALSTRKDQLLEIQDKAFSKVKKVFKIDDLTVKSTSGKSTFNPVKEALEDLKKLYTKQRDYNALERVEGLLEKGKMTVKDINNLAREYGTEFKNKAFNKDGTQKFSDVGAGFENIRTYLKDLARSKMPNDATKVIDSELSSLYKTEKLVDNMIGRVDDLTKKMLDKGIIEKLAGKVGGAVDFVTRGAIKELMSQIFVKGHSGIKTGTALEIQNMLNKNLRDIDKLIKQIDNVTPSKVGEFINKVFGPEEMRMIEDLIVGGKVRDKPASGIGEMNTVILGELNNNFNSKLDSLIKNGKILGNDVVGLGSPSEKLKYANFKDYPIDISMNNLYNKANSSKHEFDLNSIKNLPEALQEPIAVFDSITRPGTKVVLTDLEYGGKRFIGVVDILERNNRNIVNNITSVYPTDFSKILESFNQGKELFVDKQRLYEILQSSGMIPKIGTVGVGGTINDG